MTMLIWTQWSENFNKAVADTAEKSSGQTMSEEGFMAAPVIKVLCVTKDSNVRKEEAGL